jgi:MoaA/NifB/PqqE/SkfB family radical SAM enzyme
MNRILSHFRYLTPKIALRMANNQVRTWLGQRRVRNVQLALTYRCNHNCTFCSSNELLDRDREELNIHQWKDVVDQLYALGCTHFDLTGGEPTLKRLSWLMCLIQYITRNEDCIVSLATNGKLVTNYWLLNLKHAGLNSLLVDIQPGDHDAQVQDEGNLEHIKDLIAKAKRIGLNVCINTCLGTHNMDKFEELLQWATKENLHVLTNLAAPTGRLSGESVRMSEFRQFYYGLMKKYPLMRSDTTYNYFRWNRCPGGREKLYITAYGDVIMCTFNQISYGNVLENSLDTIYKRFWTNPLIRKKSICKHTFDEEFRTWADSQMKDKKLPVEYERFQQESI